MLTEVHNLYANLYLVNLKMSEDERQIVTLSRMMTNIYKSL